MITPLPNVDPAHFSFIIHVLIHQQLMFQVVDMKVQHIDAMPMLAELYYTLSGKEIVVKVIGEEAGQVVYQYNPMSAVNYVSLPSVQKLSE